MRADYERVLKQRNALLRTAYLARKAGGTAAAGTCPPSTSGTPTWPSTAPTCSPAGWSWSPRSARTWPRRTTRWRAGRGAARHRVPASLVELTEADHRPGRAGRGAAGALAAARTAEIERGVTLVGPHRDDLTLTLGELPAKGYASHGESWSYALALRLAAYELLRADGIEPVLVLDDVFAELDAGRRERLAELVGGASQLLVTCAVDDDVPAALRGTRYQVGEGTVRRVDDARPGTAPTADAAERTLGRRPVRVLRTGRRCGRRAVTPAGRRAARPGRSWPGRRSTPRGPDGRRRRGARRDAAAAATLAAARAAAARLLRPGPGPARPAAARRGDGPAGEGARLAAAGRRGDRLRRLGAGRRRGGRRSTAAR